MADAWLLIRTTNEQRPKGWRYIGDVIDVRWVEGAWTTAQFTVTERMLFYFFKVTGIPEAKREKFRRLILEALVEYDANDTITDYRWRCRGWAAPPYTEKEILKRIKGKIPRAIYDHIIAFGHPDVEQPAGNFISVHWTKVDIFYDKVLGRDVRDADFDEPATPTPTPTN